MGRNKEPMRLILAKGKSHKTKKEIEERIEGEVGGFDDKIRIPKCLTKKAEKDKFDFIAGELKRIKIITNLDCDEIARYILTEQDWISYGQIIRKTQQKIKEALKEDNDHDVDFYTERLSKYESLRSKAFNQCHACASSLGLTITSRCKLVMPRSDPEPKENKFKRFMNGEMG